MATLISGRYLDVDELDVGEAFVQAAEEAEGDIPWLIVEPSEDGVILRHGESEQSVSVSFGYGGVPEMAILMLPDALRQLDLTIRDLPGEIPEDVDLEVSLMKGVTRALDRNSSVMARERLASFDERIRGRLTGIGARIGQQDGSILIRGVFEDAPSERSGLRGGDVILRVDGISTIGMTVSQVVDRIRGEEGTTVELRVRRDGTEVLDIAIVREVVVIPNVSWNLGDSGIGYISIENFSQQTTRLMTQALEELNAEGVRGLVIDLRDNSGGSMREACQVADLFIEEGTILTTQGRNGARVSNLMQEYSASDDEDEPDVPIVVLVNSRSASASEILAGALREYDRAVLIGESSYGKGTVQKVYTLRPGDEDEQVRLKLTVAEYLIAGRLRVETGVGIAPDLWVDSAVFGREGVGFPVREEEADTPRLMLVEELSGWCLEGCASDGGADEGDGLIRIAESILDSARSSSSDAMDAALETVATEQLSSLDTRLVQTFRRRGVDWSTPRGTPSGRPRVDFDLRIDGQVRAGAENTIAGTLASLGEETLYRAMVILYTDEPSPWNGVVLPFGVVGAEGTTWEQNLTVDTDEPERVDRVTPVLHVEGWEPVELDPIDLRVSSIDQPRVVADARLEMSGDHHRVSLELQNSGEVDLSGVSVRLAFRDDTSVEILDREVIVYDFDAGERASVDLGLRVPREALGDALELELRVDAERFGRIIRAPIVLDAGGAVQHIEIPMISGDLPSRVSVGTSTFEVRASDDSPIESIRVWLDGEQVEWRTGGGVNDLGFEQSLHFEEGYHRVHLQVFDEDGAYETRLYRVWAESS